MIRKRPFPKGSFSWSRIPDPENGSITWRLFRKSIAGRVYVEARTFGIVDDRREIAGELMRMRIRLRDAVDAVDFAALGIAA